MYKLYVFLRSDLESLTPGKAAAQVAHAASQHSIRSYATFTPGCTAGLREWTDAGREPASGRLDEDAEDFGTTIVLDGGTFYPDVPVEINTLLEMAEQSGVVRDPSYPLRDGRVTHLLDLKTCAWIFFDDEKQPALSDVVKAGWRLYNGNHD